MLSNHRMSLKTSKKERGERKRGIFRALQSLGLVAYDTELIRGTVKMI